MIDWYYSDGGEPIGPHSEDDLRGFLLAGTIARDTVVWREGMAQWGALKTQPEFAALFKSAPPPLPPRPSVNEQPAPVIETEPVEEFTVEPPSKDMAYGLDLAGPWTRYFARLIDLALIGSAIGIGISLALPYISPATALAWYKVDARAAFIVLLPLAHVINALIITVFGNSIGKAIFGIRAVPIGADRFGFGDSVKREFRVWIRGMALNIPILNLFTLWNSYQEVGKGQPTSYDRGIANVKSFSQSGVRRAVGMLLAVALMLGVAYLNATEKLALEELQTASQWTNPVTNSVATIPPGWVYEPLLGPDGNTLYTFSNIDTGMVGLLGREEFAGVTMADYTESLKAALAANTPLGAWAPAGVGVDIVKASGLSVEDKWPTTIYVTQRGDAFWRIVYIDQLNKTPREIAEPGLTNALFGSIR